jgi:hypothetical protein
MLDRAVSTPTKRNELANARDRLQALCRSCRSPCGASCRSRSSPGLWPEEGPIFAAYLQARPFETRCDALALHRRRRPARRGRGLTARAQGCGRVAIRDSAPPPMRRRLGRNRRPWRGSRCWAPCSRFFGVNVGRTWDFTVDDAGISFATPATSRRPRHGAHPGLRARRGRDQLPLGAPAHPRRRPRRLARDALQGARPRLRGLRPRGHRGLPRRGLPAAARGTTTSSPRWWRAPSPTSPSGPPRAWRTGSSSFPRGLRHPLAHEENSAARFPWSSVSLGCSLRRAPTARSTPSPSSPPRPCASSPASPAAGPPWAITLGLLVASLELFRLAYFAYPFPNSFYTKKRTFDFGKDLTKFDSAGWVYVGSFVRTYKLKRTLIVLPAMLLAAARPGGPRRPGALRRRGLLPRCTRTATGWRSGAFSPLACRCSR